MGVLNRIAIDIDIFGYLMACKYGIDNNFGLIKNHSAQLGQVKSNKRSKAFMKIMLLSQYFPPKPGRAFGEDLFSKIH